MITEQKDGDRSNPTILPQLSAYLIAAWLSRNQQIDQNQVDRKPSDRKVHLRRRPAFENQKTAPPKLPLDREEIRRRLEKQQRSFVTFNPGSIHKRDCLFYRAMLMIKMFRAIAPNFGHLFLKNRCNEVPNPFRAGTIKNNLMHGRLGDAERAGNTCLCPPPPFQLKTDLQAAVSLFLRKGLMNISVLPIESVKSSSV